MRFFVFRLIFRKKKFQRQLSKDANIIFNTNTSNEPESSLTNKKKSLDENILGKYNKYSSRRICVFPLFNLQTDLHNKNTLWQLKDTVIFPTFSSAYLIFNRYFNLHQHISNNLEVFNESYNRRASLNVKPWKLVK